MKFLLNTLFLLLAGYTLLNLLAFTFQETLILQMRKVSQDHEYKLGNIKKYEIEEWNLTKGDSVRLHGIYIKSNKKSSAKGVVYFLHGNAGNIEKYQFFAPIFLRRGYDVLLWDYRGFGKSYGKQNEDIYHNDVYAMYQELLRKGPHPEEKVIIYGRSLGSGMATKLASRPTVNASMLLLETPYYNIADVAKNYFPIVKYIPLKYAFRSDQYLSEVRLPVHIFHGTADRIVPYKSGAKLRPLLKKNDGFHTIEGGRHINLYKFDAYNQKMDQLIGSPLKQ